jgi:glycosyltransferase involved in cell wall biosynthesis
MKRAEVVVIVPCYNEEKTVGDVVSAFRLSLPDATVYVYDNNSSDQSVHAAKAAGAVVRCVSRQGKGNVVRRAFADNDADVYVLVDGDGTYDATTAPRMVALVNEGGFDLVNASRAAANGYTRPGHELGNRMLTRMVAWLFRHPNEDMLSGYKAFSRRFVKSFPVFSSGFEIETELTVHALDLTMPVESLASPYGERPEGSESKLHTMGDGMRILRTIAGLVRQERPLAFFGTIAALMAIAALILGIPVVDTFFHTHKVPKFPSAILATGLMLIAFVSLVTGLILDTVTRGRKEAKMLRYLAIPGPVPAAEGGSDEVGRV